GADLLAGRLEQESLEEGRVVDCRQAERWEGLRIPLGAGADRLLKRLLAGLVVLRLRLPAACCLLARRGLGTFPLLGADVEQDRRSTDCQRVDQRAGAVHFLDSRCLVELPLEMG